MKQIDENTAKLVAGIMETMQCMVTSMSAPGGFNVENLTYLLDKRLEGRPHDDLTAVPLAVMLNGLRPKEKARPQLRLIQGGLKDKEEQD